MYTSARRSGVAALAAASLLVVLAACASTTPTTTHDRASFDRSASSAPAAPAAPAGNDAKVGFTCAEALPAGADGWKDPASFVPEPGTDAQQAIELGGIACHAAQADGTALVYSIALPSSTELTELEATAAAHGTATSDLGGQKGYFSSAKRTGTAVVFAGGYWISSNSTSFASVSDAATVTNQLIQVLPAG